MVFPDAPAVFCICEEISLKKIDQWIKKALPLVGLILATTAILMLPGILSRYPASAEHYATEIFPVISRPVVYLSSLAPISLTEIFIVFSVLSSPLLIIWYIYHAVRSHKRKQFFYRSAIVSCMVIFLISLSFTLMHGIQYARRPLHETLGIVPAERSPEELAEVMNWLAEGVVANRTILPENERGGMLPINGLKELLREGSNAMDLASSEFPVLSGNGVRVKPVALSHYWSYTGIVGMYFPFFGEANANVDVPAHTIPMTICHEISHVRGIAREQDANLAGFLACVASDRPDFRYSGYMFALGYISSDLAVVDPDEYARIARSIPESAYRDLNLSYEYWEQFEGPVEEISTEVNDAYLKSNLQPEGVHSYSLVSRLIIDYYFSHIKGDPD